MTNLLAALALAAVIAGEAPGCPVEAKVATAHVYHNRIEQGIVGGWFGDGEPTITDSQIARYWWMWPDPTDGAIYMIHPSDRQRMPWLRERTAQWTCKGTALEAWK
jgi:hypothetical protein